MSENLQTCVIQNLGDIKNNWPLKVVPEYLESFDSVTSEDLETGKIKKYTQYKVTTNIDNALKSHTGEGLHEIILDLSRGELNHGVRNIFAKWEVVQFEGSSEEHASYNELIYQKDPFDSVDDYFKYLQTKALMATLTLDDLNELGGKDNDRITNSKK